MKQFLLLLLTTMSLVSCQEPNNTSTVATPLASPEVKIIQTPQPQDNPSENTSNTQTDSALSNNVMIKNIFMDGDNCINSSSELSGTGDILTGLVQDGQFRTTLQKEYKLSVYTPEYTRTLQKDIQAGIDGFITRYMCNIGTNIDIIAGVDYSKAIDAYNSLDEKSKNNINGPVVGNSTVLFIRNSTRIIPVDTSVKLYNSTVTGGDVSHCKISKRDETVLWTCYLGLSQTEGKESYQEYRIDLTSGEVLSTRTYSEDI